MRKSVEMKKNLDALKNSIATLQAEGKTKEAYDKLAELAQMKQAIEVQEALEKEEDDSFNNGAPAPVNQVPEADAKKVANRAFNKSILGISLTAAEMKHMPQVVDAAGTPGQVGATPGKGGYLLPEEQFNRLIELRRGLVALKEYCEVIPVSRRSGSVPVLLDDSSELTNFDELNEITQKDIDFSQVAFGVKDYGEIIPASNTLLDDIDIDLVGVIGRRFMRKAVRTENTKILTLLKTLTAKAITDYKGIKTAINKDLDPALLDGSVIVTNQDGFDYLDQITLESGAPLLQPVLTDKTKKQFGGYEIVVLSNAQLATATNKIPFFVGNISDFAKFFDRKQVTIDASEHAGFTKNALFLRAIERFDVVKADADAVKYLQLTVTAG